VIKKPSRLVLALFAVLVAAYAVPAAQNASSQTPAAGGAKKALTIADYSRWRTINGAQLSGDGKWVAYGLAFTNVPQAETKPVLTILNLDTNQKTEIADATGASFSADSMWIAYTVEPGGGRGGRGGGRGGGGGAGGGAPGGGGQTPQTPAPTPATQPGRGGDTPTPTPPRHVELRSLSGGTLGPVARQWQDIQAFTFSPTSTHLVLRRRPAAAAPAAGAGRGGADTGAAPAAGGPAAATGNEAGPPRGVDVTVHDLKTDRDQLLGSVGDYSFNKSGDVLAYTVDAAVKDTNGLFVLDFPSGRVVALENDAKLYTRLAWNEKGTALAVLKGLDVDKQRERPNVLVVYANVRASIDGQGPASQPVMLDPARAAGFPKEMVLSDRAAVSWSDDSTRVYFGVKAQVPVPDATRADRDTKADVDVWNAIDERIQSLQMNRADADRNFTYRSAMLVSTGAFVKLADPTMKDIDIALTGKWAVGRDQRGQIKDWGPQTADYYRVNTMTGERTLMMKAATLESNPGISPNGRTFLYWKESKYQAWDLDTGTTKTLGGASTVSFVDTEDDHPGPKPAYGIAGYTPDGTAAIAQHRYDLWLLPLDGSAPKNLTNGLGAKNEVRYRIVRFAALDPLADYGPGGVAAFQRTVDVSKPVTLSAYGEWTKKAGFAELSGGQLKDLIWDDASFSTPTRAAKAERYLFTRQTFVEFPDLRISGADLKDSKKITDANPQQSEYLWGHRILFDYKNKGGVRLQGILAIPDDYKQGEKRPMLVTFYEKNSQNLHRYNAPSYLTGMGSSPMQAVTEGYLTMLADVFYNTGSSHSDQLDCVEAATRKVIEMGYADPKRIGVNGHSYGGEGAAFIGTRSKMFAAVGVGAGVTDLYSDFNQSWGWTYQVTGGSGANGNDYYMEGQGRWGFAPWEKPEVYHFESALTHVPETVSPILIMHGTADPTVSFTEGMNFYNALRFNKKNAIMLAYTGEGHGLSGLANRKDLTVRYFEFFNHYLKDAPAPKWMTEGVAYLDKGKEK
jgi:hypothetical protein